MSYELTGRRGGITVATAGAWPPERARFLSLHLGAGDRAMTDAPPSSDAPATFWPSSDGLTFTSAPFAAGAEIAGPVSLGLRVSTQARDLDVFAYLSALDADGALSGPVAQGWLRLSHRELDEDASGPGHPVLAHRNLLEVVPGRAYDVEVEMWPASASVPAGGSLLLSIRGSDADNMGQFRHNDPDDRPSELFAGWTTVHTGPDAVSRLTVPVVRRD